MNLHTKIIISIVVPVMLISLIWFYQIKKLTSELEAGVDASYVTQSELVRSRLDDIAYTHDYVSKVMASSKEIANALEAGDNNTLFIWGMNFISNKVTNVMFFDTEGVVVSRSPDEYRFGDNISGSYIFSRLKDTGRYLGIAIVDGEEVLACGRIVKKYDEYNVGYILLMTKIDSRLANFLNYGIEGIIGYKSNTKQLIENQEHTNKHLEIYYKYNDNEVGNAAFHLHTENSPAHKQIHDLKNRMTAISVTAFVISLVASVLLVSIHLRPYKKMMTAIILFNRKELDTIQLKNDLKTIKSADNQEISGIIDGLTEMTDIVQDKINQLNAKNEQLDKLSKTDRLTGLYNRMHLDDSMLYEVNRSERYNSPLSIILLDIDNFKHINDTHGHQTGDIVLSEFSRLLMRNVRITDIAGRWGGEEFIVICPETTFADALKAAEKVHSFLNFAPLADIDVTTSVGISEFRTSDTVHSMLKRAEEALCRAKDDGGNCIRT